MTVRMALGSGVVLGMGMGIRMTMARQFPFASLMKFEPKSIGPLVRHPLAGQQDKHTHMTDTVRLNEPH